MLYAGGGEGGGGGRSERAAERGKRARGGRGRMHRICFSLSASLNGNKGDCSSTKPTAEQERPIERCVHNPC